MRTLKESERRKHDIAIRDMMCVRVDKRCVCVCVCVRTYMGVEEREGIRAERGWSMSLVQPAPQVSMHTCGLRILCIVIHHWY